MKVYVDNVLMTVFKKQYGPAAQIVPGCCQLDLGIDRPVLGITVPSYWAADEDATTIRTSGKLLRHEHDKRNYKTKED